MREISVGGSSCTPALVVEDKNIYGPINITIKSNKHDIPKSKLGRIRLAALILSGSIDEIGLPPEIVITNNVINIENGESAVNVC